VTPHGLVKHWESLAARNAAMTTLLARLSEEDREKLAKALTPLQRLAHHAEDSPAGPTARPVSRDRAQAASAANRSRLLQLDSTIPSNILPIRSLGWTVRRAGSKIDACVIAVVRRYYASGASMVIRSAH
jgi:hypothetical protein